MVPSIRMITSLDMNLKVEANYKIHEHCHCLQSTYDTKRFHFSKVFFLFFKVFFFHFSMLKNYIDELEKQEIINRRFRFVS